MAVFLGMQHPRLAKSMLCLPTTGLSSAAPTVLPDTAWPCYPCELHVVGRNWPYLQAGEVVVPQSAFVTVCRALTLSFASPTCNDDGVVTPRHTNSYPTRRKGRSGLPPDAVRSFAHQLLSALAELHDKQAVVHRDVKPSNLLLQQPFVVRTGKVRHQCARQEYDCWCPGTGLLMAVSDTAKALHDAVLDWQRVFSTLHGCAAKLQSKLSLTQVGVSP